MTTITHTIKIQNEKFGTILNESFVDPTQFKIFLKMIQGCIELKNDLSFFNGVEFLVHIPHRFLVDSIITTSFETIGVSKIVKSKVEAITTK
jgi:hypothetical protein